MSHRRRGLMAHKSFGAAVGGLFYLIPNIYAASSSQVAGEIERHFNNQLKK